MMPHAFDNHAQAKALRKTAIGALLIEYGCREMTAKQDLKARCNVAINAANRVQDWFIHNPQGKAEQKAMFKKDFLSDRNFLLTEMLELMWNIDADSLQEIYDVLKANVVERAAA